jgi:uncharacterized paraquat-inducible protein A
MHPEVISNKPGKCPARKRNRLTNINVCPVLRGKDTFEIQSNQKGNCPKCGMTLIKKDTRSINKIRRHKIPALGIGMGLMMVGMLFFIIKCKYQTN